MFWNIMTALMDSDEWGPIPDDGWMAPGKDTTPAPPPPPPSPDPIDPGGEGEAPDTRLRSRSHKEEAPIDTPEIQGEEE